MRAQAVDNFNSLWYWGETFTKFAVVEGERRTGACGYTRLSLRIPGLTAE